MAVTRPNFAGLLPTSPMPDLYWNDPFHPHSSRMVKQKALPTEKWATGAPAQAL